MSSEVRRPTVWVLGSLNIDTIVRVDAHPKPGETVRGRGVESRFGGKGANQAVAAACAGAPVAMVGRVGADADGRAYLERLAAFGIDISGVRADPDLPTGRALIAVDAAGENTIIVSSGANGAVSLRDLDVMRHLGAGDVLLVQLEIDVVVVEAAVRMAETRGARVLLNLAPYAEIGRATLQAADPVIVNEGEAAALRADGVVPTSLLTTRGAGAADWSGAEGPMIAALDVVDTTGAGDTYCGALAAALLAGQDHAAAMRSAAIAATGSVGWIGAQPQPS